MQSFLVYILQVAGCASIALLFYKALLEKKTRVKTIRLYFLIAMVVCYTNINFSSINEGGYR